MNKTFGTVVAVGVIGGLVADMSKSAADVPHPHTHEEPLGPRQSVSFQTVAVSSGKEMTIGGPLILNRPRMSPL